MIMQDNKKITPVYGNMRPVEVRLNHQRLAGWVEESKSGEHVDFEQTYNHYADVVVHGNSVQDGVPTPDAPIPVVSVEDCNLVSRGKNLFDKTKPIYNSQAVRGEAITHWGSGWNVTDYVAIEQNRNYRISGNGNVAAYPNILFYDKNKQYIGYANGYNQTFIPPNNTKFCRYNIITNYKNTTQLEEGIVPTAYQSFCGTAISLPPLRKIGDVADTYNPKTGEYVQRIGVKVFDGVNTYVVKNDTSIGAYLYYHHIFSRTKNEGVCTHFKPIVDSGYPSAPVYEGQFTLKRHNTAAYFNFYGLVSGDNASLPNANEANAWLAAQYAAGTPVTVYYQLATPVTTYLDPAPVPTYYPWTRIEQDGAVKGVIDATAKVIE